MHGIFRFRTTLMQNRIFMNSPAKLQAQKSRTITCAAYVLTDNERLAEAHTGTLGEAFFDSYLRESYIQFVVRHQGKWLQDECK